MACNLKANDPGAVRGGDRMPGHGRERRDADNDELEEEGNNVANNQANLYIRNNLANMPAAAEMLENLAAGRDDDDGEPSNFQAWYVRSANNSRSRDRSEARLDQVLSTNQNTVFVATDHIYTN